MITAPTTAMMVLAAGLFTLGVLGFLVRRNVIIMFMSIELMLNAANLVFLTAARDRGWEVEGQVLALFVIAVAAAEVGVGLALAVALYRRRKTVSPDAADELKG